MKLVFCKKKSLFFENLQYQEIVMKMFLLSISLHGGGGGEREKGLSIKYFVYLNVITP
jgi:hypothetical protein